MDLDGLRTALAPRGTLVTIGTGTLPAPVADFLAKYYSGEGKQIQIDNASLAVDEASRSVTITGRGSFLNAANMPVTAVFSLDAQGVASAVVTYTLRDRSGSLSAWKFSTSFPDL